MANAIIAPFHRYKLAVPPEKIWEFDEESSMVNIYHYGSHSCKPNLQRNPELERAIINQFKKDQTLKACQLAQINIKNAIQQGNWEEVEQISGTFCDEQYTQDLRTKAMKEASSHGHSFKAVGMLKQSTDKRGKFYIYDINDRHLNGKMSYIFKTSQFKLQLIDEMNKTNGHTLSKEYAHIDGKVNRCPGFTTITLSVFHAILQKQIPLVIMEAESESHKCITTFWDLVDKALEEYRKEKFNPFGLISDEAGAFWKSDIDHFNKETISNNVSCEFHLKENINKHAKNFCNDEDKLAFKKICFQWLEVGT